MNSKLVQFLTEGQENTWRIVACSFISGIAVAAMIVIINIASQGYAQERVDLRFFALFTVTLIIYILTKKYALSRTADLAQSAIFESRIRISDKLRHTDLVDFERIGKSVIFTTLSENTEAIMAAAKILAESFPALIMLFFSFLYVSHLSMTAFKLILFMMIFLVVLFLYFQRSLTEDLRKSVVIEESFFTTLQHLISGFQEIKVNQVKSEDLFTNHLQRISNEACQVKIETEQKYTHFTIFSNTIVYVLLASIVFLLPQISDLKGSEITAIISVVLFIMGPIGILVGGAAVLAKGDVAVETLEKLEASLQEKEEMDLELMDESLLPKTTSIQQIQFENVCFEYPHLKHQQTFSIGPLSLTVKAGEVLYIVGGNGSGKSTLLKLITGLYSPKSGIIRVDDQILTEMDQHRFRNYFSIIFTNFYLFDRLYGMPSVDREEIHRLLKEMKLEGKTHYVKGRFTNTTNLSTGQKKRLALIVALMEDKPIYIFDEVAADQDPTFRQHFYQHTVKRLAERGKIVILVSHDEAYFPQNECEGKVVRMDFGQLSPYFASHNPPVLSVDAS